jgi:hypothetical protein
MKSLNLSQLGKQKAGKYLTKIIIYLNVGGFDK